jgi:NitT/TauT family transport system substrate-binding protein
LRAWLKTQGLKTSDKGGDVTVMPIANPDQLTLFMKKEIDAAWAPEPWASRLVHDAGGRIFLDERTLWPQGQFLTTELVVSTNFLQSHPDLAKKWLQAHIELTDWINGHVPEAKQILNQQIQRETGKALATPVLDDSFSRLQVTYDPLRAPLLRAAQLAFDAGFLGRQMPDLSRIYDLTLLNQVLSAEGKKAIQ